MTEEETDKEASTRAERMMSIRSAIFDAIPDESNAYEICVSGLSVFLQAALLMADHDKKKVMELVDHVMELAQDLNKADEEAGIWPPQPDSVH